MKTTLFTALVLLSAGALFAQPTLQLGNPAEWKEGLPPVGNVEGTFSGADLETTEADQTDVAVTVYNSNRGLVRDRRKVKMLPGEVELRFSDVAAQIKPETVSLRSLTAPQDLRVLEQNYEYDLMSPEKLMEKYVGKELRLLSTSTELNFNEIKAKLLSVNNGPIYEIEGAIHIGHPGTVVLPEIPDELIAEPSLIWQLENDGTDHEIEATYLTEGINWRADYVLSLAKDERRMGLEAWVTLDNQSGAAYRNAQLKLVAGDVNVVMEDLNMSKRARAAGMMEMAAAAPPMREESFAEYHLYTLQRRTTIKQNQSKQVSLLSVSEAPVAKVYEYRGRVEFYSQAMPPMEAENVDVFLTFKNEEAAQMGMPLPGGIVRVYQEDQDGMRQFAGEDRLQHTPKDEEVRLRLGKAFDVKAERKQLDFQNLGPNQFEAQFEIAVRNHKETPVTVAIVEPMPADWSIIQKSHDFEKKDAFTAIFKVDVPVDGEVKVNYRVRVRY